jgi:hypothetical protein
MADGGQQGVAGVMAHVVVDVLEVVEVQEEGGGPCPLAGRRPRRP